jgi:nitrite reductase/ring-hydroxylating ferredoxin subunit
VRKVLIVSEFGVSRRNLICGLVAAGAAVPLIAACGSSDATHGPAAGAGGPAGGSGGSSGGTSGGASSGGGSGGSSAAAAGSIKTSEIPVGGGKIFPDRNIVVTQPKAGEFEAFSASCTHQGTQLNQISAGRIICPLHGSQFSINNGAVEQGPASSPLPKFNVTVTGATLEVSG